MPRNRSSRVSLMMSALLVAGLPIAGSRAGEPPARKPASGMTVQQAYQSHAGHRHTDFDPTAAGFNPREAAYLVNLFDLVDLAIVEKTQAWTWFQSGGRAGAPVGTYKGRIDSLVTDIDRLPAPERLQPVRTLIVEAIREQTLFFEAWEQSERGGVAKATDDKGRYLQSSSQKLHQAYGHLRVLFPEAGKRNFDSFYDHLCVLDLQ
jgi:hypothetical protein